MACSHRDWRSSRRSKSTSGAACQSVFGRHPACQPRAYVLGRGDGFIAHDASERAHAAAGNRRCPRRDGAHHGPRFQQAGGEVLIVPVKLPRRPDASPPSRASGSRNHVASESAFTARGTKITRDRPGPSAPSRGEGIVLEECHLSRETDDGRTRISSAARGASARGALGPSCSSSALMRWLTAEGVTWRRRAAASNEPSSMTAARRLGQFRREPPSARLMVLKIVQRAGLNPTCVTVASIRCYDPPHLPASVSASRSSSRSARRTSSCCVRACGESTCSSWPRSAPSRMPCSSSPASPEFGFHPGGRPLARLTPSAGPALPSSSAYGLLAAGRAWRPSGSGARGGHPGVPSARSCNDASARRRSRVRHPRVVDQPCGPHRRRVPLALAGAVLTCLALTWLNPHVYLDTVFLLGSVANTHGEESVALRGRSDGREHRVVLRACFRRAVPRPLALHPARVADP